MRDLTLFTGRLRRQGLPLLRPDSGADPHALKRLLLPQGELAQFHDSAEGIRYIAALELKTKGLRGNHFHESKVEHVYMVRGRMRVIARDLDSDEEVEMELETGDLAVIQPRIAHAFRVLEEGAAIEFAPGRFDPTDIHPYSLTGS